MHMPILEPTSPVVQCLLGQCSVSNAECVIFTSRLSLVKKL